jgi:hypothetical protein
MESEAAVIARSGAVRSANDRIRGSAERLRFENDQRVPFVCECGNADCLATVMVTLTAYASVREDARRFLLLAGHENVAAERVVDDGHALGYVVVERRPVPEIRIR